MKPRIPVVIGLALAVGATVVLGVLVIPNSSAAPPIRVAATTAEPSQALHDFVRRNIGRPASPLVASAGHQLEHLLTPADASLPSFFAAPTTDGGRCVATSDLVIASCLTTRSRYPGTITVRDNSEADSEPPFVYGLVRPSVETIILSVAGSRYTTEPANSLYVFPLTDAALTVSDVTSVTYVLRGGATVERRLAE